MSQQSVNPIVIALSCGMLYEPVSYGSRLPRHPGCYFRDSCRECTLGIVDTEDNRCPFCNSDVNFHPGDNSKYSEIYTGTIHRVFRCGTILNICQHFNDSPNSITSVVIGPDCRGMLTEDTI